jgi:dipeptidyl aminopeptidase/acylaminoacyl peptidase
MTARGRIVAALAAATLVATAAAGAEPLTIADAFEPSLVDWMRLSPDGKRLLAIGANEVTSAVILLDVETMTPKVLRSAIGGKPWTMRWLGNDLVAVAVRGETHIYDADGKFLRRIGRQFIATLPPDAQGHERILVHADWGDVERVDVRTGEATRIRTRWPDGGGGRFLVDREGVPRVLTRYNEDRTMQTHWYRASADAPWQPIEAQLTIDRRWSPAALARDGRSLIVFSAEGRDTTAVFRYSLEEHALQEMLAGHPSEDIGSLEEQVGEDDSDADEVADRAYVRVVTLGMRPETHWFEPRWAALQAAVDAALPGRVNFLSGHPDSGRILVLSSGDVDPGTWYLLDLASKALTRIESRKPEIDRTAMRPKQIVRYRSLDGLEIPAYLTLPPGGRRDLPAVVLVHGGPIVRDRWDWDPEVQLLAARGYAVLQPQFRGSSGFGKAFRLAGYREWGRAMQDDVTAGAQWLAAQGIADPRRICIYGGSYGGYAALMALVKTPDLFRCGASLAGVSDLSLMFSDDSDANRDAFGRLFRRRTVGDPDADAKLFDEVSPLQHAGRVQVPVLLAHGDQDERVPIVHSEKMVRALKESGKKVEWIELRGEGHGFRYKKNRQRFYDALFEFLANNTALPAAATATAPAATPMLPTADDARARAQR